MSCSYFLGVFPPRDPARPFGSKYLSPIHTTYQSGIIGQGGGGNRVNKAKTLTNSLSIYEEEDFR